MYFAFFKRLIDFLLSLVGLLLLSPLFLFITVVLFLANRGFPFFVQDRPGKNCKIFKVIKFKTMNDRRDKKGELLPDSVRLTAMGKFIRQTSLDEIPQLMQVRYKISTSDN